MGEAELQISTEWDYAIWVSYAEIYNEKIYDLLDSPNAPATGNAGLGVGMPATFSTMSLATLASSAASAVPSNGPLGANVKRKALSLKHDRDGTNKYVASLTEIRVWSADVRWQSSNLALTLMSSTGSPSYPTQGPDQPPSLRHTTEPHLLSLARHIHHSHCPRSGWHPYDRCFDRDSTCASQPIERCRFGRKRTDEKYSNDGRSTQRGRQHQQESDGLGAVHGGLATKPVARKGPQGQPLQSERRDNAHSNVRKRRPRWSPSATQN